MFDFTKLWDKIYLFGPPAAVMSRSGRYFFYLAVGLVLIGIAAKIAAWYSEHGRPRKILLGRVFHLCLTTGLGLFIWYGARVEQIPLISTHVTALLVLAIFVIWFGFIAYFFWRKFRREERAWIENQIKQKYLKK